MILCVWGSAIMDVSFGVSAWK